MCRRASIAIWSTGRDSPHGRNHWKSPRSLFDFMAHGLPPLPRLRARHTTTQSATPVAMAIAACPIAPHAAPPPYPTSPKYRRFGTPRFLAISTSTVGSIVNFTSPSTSDADSPASLSAAVIASSAMVRSGRPMSLTNSVCPIPAMAAASRSTVCSGGMGSV